MTLTQLGQIDFSARSLRSALSSASQTWRAVGGSVGVIGIAASSEMTRCQTTEHRQCCRYLSHGNSVGLQVPLALAISRRGIGCRRTLKVPSLGNEVAVAKLARGQTELDVVRPKASWMAEKETPPERCGAGGATESPSARSSSAGSGRKSRGHAQGAARGQCNRDGGDRL